MPELCAIPVSVPLNPIPIVEYFRMSHPQCEHSYWQGICGWKHSKGNVLSNHRDVYANTDANMTTEFRMPFFFKFAFFCHAHWELSLSFSVLELYKQSFGILNMISFKQQQKNGNGSVLSENRNEDTKSRSAVLITFPVSWRTTSHLSCNNITWLKKCNQLLGVG